MPNNFNVNQFAPLPQIGMCLNPSHGQRIEAEYFPSTATDTITICAPCKFVAGDSNVNNCVDVISEGDIPTAGILIYDSSKRNVYAKHQYVTLARMGSIVLLQASAAITANDYVTIAVDGTIATSTTNDVVIGIAMNSAAKDAPTRVLLVEPFILAPTATALDQKYQAKLTAGDFVAIDSDTNTITTTYTAGANIAISDEGEISYSA